MLTETAPPTITQAMREELSRHMRLASGFASDQDQEVEAAFRAALAHLETSLGLCLAPRAFVARVRLDDGGSVVAPIGPVKALTSVSRISWDGTRAVVDPALFSFDVSASRTRVCGLLSFRGLLEISFEAGFGDDWSATPADLRRAAQMLAAHYFDQRQETTGKSARTPYGVSVLTQPWRPVRIGMGGGA